MPAGNGLQEFGRGLEAFAAAAGESAISIREVVLPAFKGLEDFIRAWREGIIQARYLKDYRKETQGLWLI